MSGRKTQLVDCNPRWGTYYSEVDDAKTTCFVTFDCPEGHAGCHHTIAFTPAMDGSAVPHPGHAQWQRSGDTFETLTLSPSIRRAQLYPDRDAALAAGVLPEHFTESLTCALHIFIKDGTIEFCGDSR